MGDRSGVVIVPQEHIEEVLDKAEALYTKEENMIRDIRNGQSMMDVDTKYNYEKMLNK